MIELYHGNSRGFLSTYYKGPKFDAVITDPPYASGTGACRPQCGKQAGGASGIARSGQRTRLCEFPGGATLSERSASTAEKYTNTKRRCPFPDFAGDQMDARSWMHMMADVLELARVHCHKGAVLVIFCDWDRSLPPAVREAGRRSVGNRKERPEGATMRAPRRQMQLLSDAIQWAGWTWRGTIVWDKMSSRPQKRRFRQQAEFALWASNGKLPIDRPVPILPGVFQACNVQGAQRLHQTQKPIGLMRSVCKICVPRGRILDPFAGSGSTLEAAKLEGFDSVGVEISSEIARTASERLGTPLRHIQEVQYEEV